MTYARARLWLGISGVGSIVVLATAALAWRWPPSLFPDSTAWSPVDLIGLGVLVGSLCIVMLPFDLLGGWVLPRTFGREEGRFLDYLPAWAAASLLQGLIFLLVGAVILAVGRWGGPVGAILAVAALTFCFLASQRTLLGLFTPDASDDSALEATITRLRAWEFDPPLILVVENRDRGFTGGVVGWPGAEVIIVPVTWLKDLTSDQLATAIARRVVAIRSGSHAWGLAISALWVVVGFGLATLLPGAGVASVAELVSTCCGCALWTFLGLLTLPTLSRHATGLVDAGVIEQGVPPEVLRDACQTLDRLQDDEPSRPAYIEAIFYPAPSLENRTVAPPSAGVGAWHVARQMLFLSWASMGLLSRAVHCNAGRPELWIMLPTD